MKRVIITLALICIGQLLSSMSQAQTVSFGLPSNQNEINSKSIIVTNLPINTNGRFIPSDDLNNLIAFLKGDFDYNLTIEINFFYGSPGMNKAYSESLVLDMKDLLEYHSIGKYEIISNGSSNPIFLNEESEWYKFINTRLEIHVK